MNSNSFKLFLLAAFVLIAGNTFAQTNDSLRMQRDAIGDLNSDAIRKGEVPGTLLIPGTNISLGIGGFIKATAMYDTKYIVKNEIIMPGTFTTSQIDEGQFYLGAKSSRLFFMGISSINNLQIKGYYEMDFRGSYGFTLRHAYLQIRSKAGSELLMGQYWSLVMDLKGIPEGLVEPTLSGGGFARHGQIRLTQPLSKSVGLTISLEEPDLSDYRLNQIKTINRYPDMVGVVSYDPSSKIHVSMMGMYRPVKYNNLITTENDLKNAFLSALTVVLKPGTGNKISLAGMLGSGASGYIMGADGTSAWYLNGSLYLQKQYGAYATFHHAWDEKFRSNIAYGRFMAGEFENNETAHIKSSTYAFVNTYYRVNKYLNIGLEYIYTQKEVYNGNDLSNHRIQFGLQVF